MASLSPMRYPGGKSRAVDYVAGLIPSGTKEICSPFFGGGSIELDCASKGIITYGYDVFVPLVEFWQCIISDPGRLANEVQSFYPLSKDRFYEIQKSQRLDPSKYCRAAMFYVLNRASFSGSTLSGGMSPGHPRFTQSSIDKVRNFNVDCFSVKRKSFEESLKECLDMFTYLDPPYMITNCLYGNKGNTHRGFDHKALFSILNVRDGWILSYNDCPEIRKMYAEYRFLCPSWKYGMSKNKNSKEVIILSKDIVVPKGY